MKQLPAFILIMSLSLGFSGCSATVESSPGNEEDFTSRKVTLFNDSWEFTKDSTGASGWESVRLPHTPQIEPLIVNDQWQGTCWYRKSIPADTASDRKIFLKFEGVMHEADVWVGEQHVMNHKGGYLPFSVDVTPYLNDGAAEVRVKVNNKDNAVIPPGKPLNDLDFNYYGGIYRSVYLVETSTVHITDAVAAGKPASGGVVVYFDSVNSALAKGILRVHFQNSRQSPSEVYFTAALKNDGHVIEEWQSESVNVAGNSDEDISQMLQVENPKLWSPQHPNLYQLEIKLYADGEQVDQITESTGIRDIALKRDGFYLNGEEIFIRGTNRHQEYPYVGYAISPEADFRDAVKIKNAGFDLVRLSHYPQSREFLDACDELGLIVMNCIPGWQFFEEGEFRQNSYQDAIDMIRRDRNHPSIFFWEVSLNESGMDDAYIEKVNEILDEELPFANIYSAGWTDHAAYDLFIPARQHAKPPVYWNNYKNGDRKIFIAEYGDWEYYAQNAGFNQKAFADLKEEERTSRQLRGSGEKRLLQQALNFQEAANSNRKGRNTIGDANWLMFDYNRGYADDIESSGISDIFRIPKFSYYFYQSQRPAAEKLVHPALESGPMVKIASYWEPSSAKEVRVFSNCEEVELFLNDKSVSRNKPDNSAIADHLQSPPFDFQINAFEEGTLKAVGYLDGEVVAEDMISTPAAPAKIKLSVDKSSKAVTSNDVVFVYAQILDGNDNELHENGLAVNFSIVSGEAEIVGGNAIKTEAGIATILLKTQASGILRINAEREGLEGAEIAIEVLQTAEGEGIAGR